MSNTTPKKAKPAARHKQLQAAAEQVAEIQASAPPPQIDELLLNKLLRFMAEVQAANSSLAVLKMQRAQLIAQIDPEGRLARFDEEARLLSQSVQHKHNKYTEVVRLVESRLGIQLSKYVLDDETGVLSPIEE